MQIEVPYFQLNGTFDITLEAAGSTTTKLEGDALAIEGACCAEGSVYAYISEIPSVASTIAVNDIAATPAVMNLTAGGTKPISVIGMKGGLYSNVGIDAADCTITSEDTAVATVSDGIVTGVAAGTTYVNVKYNDIEDVIRVTVA